MELLDVVDEYGNPTGEVVERFAAHAQGVRHRTSHVWVYKIEDGRPQLLLQKRCETKASFPGCYDISSAGHIPAGDSYEESAVRELKEELGVDIAEKQLISCGVRTACWDDEFHGVPYHDREITKVFLLRLDGYTERDFTVQESEVESVCFMDWAACIEGIRTNNIRHCIVMEELSMLEAGDARLKVK